MRLYIDTTSSEKIVIKLDDETHETATKLNKSQALLPFIVDTLAKKNTKLQDLTVIEVNPGPGSFTGIRVGYAVAQALAWSLKISSDFSQINYQKD